MSVINAAVRNQLLEAGISPIVIDLAPARLGRGWSIRLKRMAKVVCELLHFLKSRPQTGDVLYMSVSGGFGQVFESLFAALARILGLRIYLHHHSYAYLDKAKLLPRWLLSIAGSEATHIVLSVRMAARLRGAYPICSRVIPLSNSVSVEPLMRASVRTRQSVETIGFLGNISDEKGVFDFLHVVSKLESEGWNFSAKLAGPFDDVAIEKRVRHYLQLVRTAEYVGPMYGDKKSAFFEGLDVLLFPTRYANEAEPVTIHEAMAHGVPVIAFGRGSIEDLITVECGLVVDTNDDFVQATLLQLKAWRKSPETFHKASIEARSRFELMFGQSAREWAALRAELCAGVGLLT